LSYSSGSPPGVKPENEQLRAIVRVRTHREHGCICERCVESEYDVARVVAALRAELDANGRDSCKLAGDVWRAHRNGMLADCDDCPYSTPVFVQAWWLGYGQTAAEQRWYDLRVGMVAELDAVRARLADAKEVIGLSWSTLHYYGHNPGEQHVNASPSRRLVNEAMNKARAFLLAEEAVEKAEAALKPADAGGESKPQ